MFAEFLKQILLIWAKFSTLQRVIGGMGIAILFFLSIFMSGPKPIEKSAVTVVEKERRGFELFDSNTWIKGEKELQILELRALKGQLEKEIEKFENIVAASVILDLGSNRSRTGLQTAPKASVLLTITPGVVLSESLVFAIVSHLVGGIRGLDPQDVSISDARGRIYKGPFPAMDKLIQEERIQKKVEDFLLKAIPSRSFHTHFSKDGLVLFITGDKLEGLEKALKALIDVPVTIQWVSITKPLNVIDTKKTPSLLYFSPLLLLLALPLFLRKKKKRRNDKEMHKIMRTVDLERLVDLIQREKPQTIAMLLTYLDRSRVEKVVSALPSKVQEEVLAHLKDEG